MPPETALPQPARPAAPTRPAPAPEAEAGAGGGAPAAAFGLLADNAGFVARLGPTGWHLGAAFLSGEQVPLEGLPQPIPGVRLDAVQWRNHELRLRGGLSIPYLDDASFEVRVNREGTARIQGSATKQLALPALGNPRITIAMSETGALSGEVTFRDMNFLPRGLGRGATATGSGTVRLADGRLSGDGTVELAYRDLGNGTVNFAFSETGAFTASGTFRVTPPFVEEVSGDIAVDEGNNLTVNALIAVGEMRTSLPGLSLTGGTLTLGYQNGQPSGGIEGFTASYNGLGSVTLETATIAASGFGGTGTFNLEVPGLNETSGRVTLRNGNVSGSLRLGADAFPRGLPVTRPSLTVTLGESGRVGVEGSATVNLGPAGTGNFTAAYSEAGQFSFGGDVTLTIPGLTTVTARVGHADGDISGEMQVPVNTALLPGLDGTVTVRYAQNRWWGETTLAYSADNGKLSGSITVTVTQTEEGALELGGEGSVTAQIAPRLQGTLTARILPGGAIDVSGTIEVTEPLELFPEQRMDRELFRYSQNIPLWAILVAVIRIRAGVRAGIGPGVFRNIRVEGSYTIGAAEADPTFTVTGELFIPAFVEGYVAFGVGLGVDVVLGSLTGGIEAVGTAGLYGAISVVPALTYADGDWGIEGTATMAAGARLKLGLNAWAEIEALRVTVWDREWNLAEVVMPVGTDLGLQAHMSYKFGRPEPPTIEMTSSEEDYSRLIQDAMPEDGPAPSGARESLQNRAEWQGQLREQRAAAVPPEQVAQQAEPATPPAAPPRPPQQTAPPGGQGGAAGGAGPAGQAAPTATQDAQPGTNPSSANQPARSQAVDQAAAPDANVPGAVPEGTLPNANQPRYPHPITLAMLDEPPAPTPRTPSQEAEDVDAAGRMVELASAQASDSDALDNYFPRIKQRFGLVSLGYEGDFDTGFQVVGKINPEFKRTVSEPLSGTGLPGALNQGHQSKITFEHSQLGGSQVGLTMRAKPLGPDHEQGSGPTGQEALMNQLPTDPNHYRDPAQRYIRGHLLNDHIGGPGHPMNLFPITASANAEHERSVESFAKNWVNNRKLWIEYVVEIRATPTLQRATGGLKKIDSVIDATAAALDTNLNRIAGLTKHVTISSTYNAAEEAEEGATNDFDAALVDPTTAALQAQRPQDQALTPPRSARETPTTFPANIATTIAQAVTKLGSRSRVAAALQNHPGFGDVSESVLFQVYDRVGATGATVDFLGTPAEKGVLTRIINAWGGANGLGARLEREMSQKSGQGGTSGG